jgi:hypothetical protein
VEQAAWKSITNVTTNFLGNYKAENHRDMVADFVRSYTAMGFYMSLKLHFLDCHLGFFPHNFGAVGDEQRELFHQNIFTTEKRYLCKWNPNMLTDSCRTLRRDVSQAKYTSKSSNLTL